MCCLAAINFVLLPLAETERFLGVNNAVPDLSRKLNLLSNVKLLDFSKKR